MQWAPIDLRWIHGPLTQRQAHILASMDIGVRYCHCAPPGSFPCRAFDGPMHGPEPFPWAMSTASIHDIEGGEWT
jgi:hypothetical protein